MAPKNDAEDADKNQPRGDFNLLAVAKDKKPKKKVILVIGSGVLFLFLAIGTIFYLAFSAMESNNPSKVDESKVKADPALATKPVSDDDIQKRREQILQRRKQEEKKKAEEAESKPQPKPTQTNANPDTPPPSAAYLRKLSGGLLVQETGGGTGQSSTGSASPEQEDEPASRTAATSLRNMDTDGASELGASGAGENRGSLSALNNSSYPMKSASLSPDRKYLLKRKTNIRCALYTAVKTNYPGFVKCTLTQPVYSSDGSVILAEAGAELEGEQKVEIRPGQTSVFTTWSDLETAGGVRANLNALGTGAMGESGTEAFVDNHYSERFGGAVMLSFIQDAFATAAKSTSSNSSTYSFDNSESNAEDMASKALDNSINIPPTGYVLPGTVINVIVAQDIDFSSVFKTRK